MLNNFSFIDQSSSDGLIYAFLPYILGFWAILILSIWSIFHLVRKNSHKSTKKAIKVTQNEPLSYRHIIMFFGLAISLVSLFGIAIALIGLTLTLHDMNSRKNKHAAKYLMLRRSASMCFVFCVIFMFGLLIETSNDYQSSSGFIDEWHRLHAAVIYALLGLLLTHSSANERKKIQ